MASVHIHRFRSRAGLAILRADGTVYLDADNAEAIGRGLIAIAESIRREEFSKSSGLTMEAEAAPNTHF